MSLRNIDEITMKVLDEAMLTWILLQYRHKRRSLPLLYSEVCDMMTTFQNELDLVNKFKPNRCWVERFKLRHKVVILKYPVPSYRFLSFNSFNPFDVIQKHGVHPAQVYVVDESGLYWRFKSTETLEPHLLTLLICTNISGEHRLPAFVVGKIKSPPSLDGIDIPISYRHQPDGLMSRELFMDWFHNCFVPEVHQWMASKKMSQKAVLILNSATWHPQEGNLANKQNGVKVYYIPFNHDAQSKSKVIFNFIKKKYKTDFLSTVISHPNDIASLTRFNVKSMAYLLADCWSGVPKSMLSSWGQSVLEDQELDPDTTSDDVGSCLLDHVCSQFNLKKEVMQSWYDGVGEDALHVMTDYQILQHALNRFSDVYDEEEPINTPSFSKVTALEAFNALQLCLGWAQENGNSSSDTTVLRSMKVKAISMLLQRDSLSPPKKRIKLSQSDIDSDSDTSVVFISEMTDERRISIEDIETKPLIDTNQIVLIKDSKPILSDIKPTILSDIKPIIFSDIKPIISNEEMHADRIVLSEEIDIKPTIIS